jgi:hypothetical protein
MLGRFSGEWVGLATLLIVTAAVVGGKTAGVHPAWAMPVFLVVYGFLRLAGRTPIGITYENDPAARGHPVLSLPAALVIAALALRAGLAAAFETSW